MCRWIFALLALVLMWSPSLRAEDLRDKLGTRSLEVAKHLDAAIRLAQTKHPEEALKEVEAAVAGDPNCALAWFWKGQINMDMGDMDKGIDAYKKCIALDVDPTNREVTTTAKTNLGLTYGELKKLDESAYWFSRSIVDDPENKAKEQAKAYRNLALTLHFENQDFAASVAAISGHDIDAEKVEEKMIDDFGKLGKSQEAARVLCLEAPAPKLNPRTEPASMKEVKLATPITERVIRLLPDPKGQFVLAMVAEDHYYTLNMKAADVPVVNKVAIADGKVVGACIGGGKLFVVVGTKLQELEPMTGKQSRSWDLGTASPKSIAVLPSKNAAFFPIKDSIQRLNLVDGKMSDMDLPGQVVSADLTEKYLYARLKDEEVQNQHMVIVDGHPIFIQSEHFDWMQTTLFQYYVAPSKLMIAAVRLNASANGYDPVVSPDGQWVCCPGGGGWRPDGGQNGYNIGVYSTADIAKVQQCINMDIYPRGGAFNPVTQEFAGLNSDAVKIFHMGASSPQKAAIKIAGKFGDQAAWSGDGRWLVVANDGQGVSLYQDTLTPDEMKASVTWWQKLTPAPVTAVAANRPVVRAVEALVQFVPGTDKAVLARMLTVAMASNATDKPLKWKEYPAYTANPATLAAIADGNAPGLETGVRLYKFKQAMEKDPQSVVLKYHLADAMAAGGQAAGARMMFLDVIHADAGRTELTVASLHQLMVLYVKDGQLVSAAICGTQALALDRVNVETIRLLKPLLTKLQFTDAANAFDQSSVASSGQQVPLLKAAGGNGAVLQPADLFQACAPSIVLIHCGNSAGTGVCVGKAGIILTSLHVVGDGDVEVIPFAIEGGKAHRMEKIPATILAQDSQEDLAILQVNNPPASMVPLSVADHTPATGEKVYAIGNPGLGRQTLDLSMSEGIVSAPDRKVKDQVYVQHTAAVNPGNSGGPLLDSRGCVVALVCLKADLEGVSFATPVETIRAFFAKNGPGK